MNTIQTTLYLLRNLLSRNEGQDLVEYSLVFSMIAFGCISGMGYLATGLNTVFSSSASILSSSIT